tara:strand:+ start:4260 stop:4733 length:474 start_codon:yes stop_codon:yes gene_type:complete
LLRYRRNGPNDAEYLFLNNELRLCKNISNSFIGPTHHETKSKENLIERSELSFSDPTKMKHFQPFDDHFISPIHGFDSAHEYYRQSSSRQFLINVNKSSLIILAKDVPFMTTKVLPTTEELSKSVTLEKSQQGGHVGFIRSNAVLPISWFETRIHSF